MDPKEKKIIKNRNIVFHENQTIENIEKPMKSFSSMAYDFVRNAAPAQITTDNNKMHKELPEAEEEREDDVKLGEIQSPKTVGPS